MCIVDIREDIGNRTRQDEFDQTVARKHYLTRQDVNNIRRKVKDTQVMWHQDNATSISLVVAELQQEPFNPVLVYKPQSMLDNQYPSLPMESSF